MELFIIRHATAVDRREGRDDATRRLTDEGREKFRRAVDGLEELGVRFDRHYHSPWTRAVETADEAARLLDGESVVTQALASPPRPALLEELRGQRVAVVGHEPWLGQLVAWLVLGDESLGDRFELKKGCVVWLEGPPQPGKMILKALFTPKVLRAAG
jgi:phosphohistidine phosphatase